MPYVLAINPVAVTAALMRCGGWRRQGGALVSSCKLIVSPDESIPSGVAELEKLRGKWYRVDARLLEALMGYRWCAEFYAPTYTVRLLAPEAVLADLPAIGDLLDVQVALADLVEKDGALLLVPLFKVTGVDLKKFLEGEAQFARALSRVVAECTSSALNVADKAAKALSEALQACLERQKASQ